MTEGLLIVTLLLAKHFLCDFVLQTAYILNNRRIYGHPAGILHVAIHGLGSLAAFLVAGAELKFAIALIIAAEMVAHYHIDWSKDVLQGRLKLSTNDRPFWWFLGFDQFLHQITYVLMVAWYVT